MALSEKQVKALRAKLRHEHVKTREIHGTVIPYVEGWHVIAEANRIFGFDNWDRQTQTPECLWSETQRGQTVCFYSAKVRITVRSGETTTVREGIGTGLGRSPQAEVAHEMAVKAAETDATKRALATFGNPFGLALYDREQANVTKRREKSLRAEPTSSDVPPDGSVTGTLDSGSGPSSGALPSAPVPALPSPRPLILMRADERTLEVTTIADYVDATKRELQQFDTLDAVYAFWTRNLNGFAEVGRRDEALATQLVSALKERLQDIGRSTTAESAGRKSGMLIPKETRVRDKDHLTFVARQPCLVCGRRPAQAHHLKFAQPRAMSMKVSDEYTVPLCNGHHDDLHKAGDERAWWARHGIIEPLKFAARLWAASRNGERDGYEERGRFEAEHVPAVPLPDGLRADAPPPRERDAT